jgi:hypothetical protein
VSTENKITKVNFVSELGNKTASFTFKEVDMIAFQSEFSLLVLHGKGKKLSVFDF